MTVQIIQRSGQSEAARRDETVQQNADFTSVTFAYVTAALAAINLTSWTATMHVRTAPNESATSIVSLTSGSGITLGGAAGTFSWAMLASATTALTPGTYFYDLFLIGTGNPAPRHKVLSGRFIVEGSVS